MSRQKVLADIKSVCRKLTPPYNHPKYKRKGGKFGLREIKKYVGDWDHAVLEAMDKGFDEVLIHMLQKPTTVIDIANSLEIPPKRANQLITDLERKGVEITKDGDFHVIQKRLVLDPQDQEFKLTPREKSRARIAFVSDSHIGSHCQQLTYLRDFYNLCAEREVDAIYHSGDLFAGNGKVYRGQEYEMFIHGLDEVMDYFCENYPQAPGIKTYFITGNHDLSWYKAQGIDVGKMVGERRTDMIYLGQMGAYITIASGPRLYLQHPDGGGSYALSYKPQKFVEGFSSENKPKLFSIGHYHTAGYFDLRNVHVFMSACFESQTGYLRRKGLMPAVGAWIVDLELTADNSIEGIFPFYKKYFKMIPRDYKMV